MRILVMDMDIIMAPCIKLYNHIADGDKVSPTQLWQTANEMMEIEKYLSYDANTLHKLHRIILNNPHAHYVPVEYSAGVVEDMQRLSVYEEEQFDIVHVGWHHNAGIRHEDLSEVIRRSKFKNSNWLGYLLEKDKVKSCYWFKALNAPGVPANQPKLEQVITCPFSALHEDEQFDIIYIVSSPQWVPYKYQHLVDILVDAATYTLPQEG